MIKVICPYCKEFAVLVTGKQLYPHRRDLAWLNFWQCEPCKAHVGCHKLNHIRGLTGAEPLGRLANEKLRALKSRAHSVFDPIWESEKKTRREAYSWLAFKLQIPLKECHIGHFDESTCKKVIEICEGYHGL